MSTHNPELLLSFLERISNYTTSFMILSFVLVEFRDNGAKHVPTSFSLIFTCHYAHSYYLFKLRFTTTYLTLPLRRV
jgi:hypothetical protein